MPTADYMREYRQTLAGQAAMLAQKRRDKARRRAVARLIVRFTSTWEQILADELRKVEAEFAAEQDQVDG